MSKLSKRIKKGLEEVLAHEQGKIHLRSIFIEVPEPPSEYKAQDIKKIRENNNYSQGVFAKILNVSIRTIQSWEAGNRIPSHAALRLIEIVDKGIYCPEIYKKN